MEEKVILSICIPSHNRVDVILENLKDILKVSDDRFDIIIQILLIIKENWISCWKLKTKELKFLEIT